MIAHGWDALLEDLRNELRAVDSAVELIRIEVDEYGLLRLKAQSPEGVQGEVRRMLRHYESRATTTCERCGNPAQARAGAILTFLCDNCTK